MNLNELSKGAVSARLPITLNIIGKNYHLETSLISNERMMIKILEDSVEFIPNSDSNILLFINLNLNVHQIVELKGKIEYIEKLAQNKKAVWIKFETHSENDFKKIKEYIEKTYIPRYELKIQVEVMTEKNFFNSESSNISENGILIRSDYYEIKENEICILNLYFENESIEQKAELSWVQKVSEAETNFGFKFIHNGQSRYKMNDIIKQIRNNSKLIR